CITFRTPQEACQKLQYLLSHQDLAMKISDTARRRILAEHTYTQRIQTILDVVRQQHSCAHTVCKEAR
ncbi:MAG TPA: glycosyltransferase family 1 protein, partial [Bacteroidetes bacterium]|nr:glycosyltransferase family 1 protein [Bacteroidota bacterium]HEX05359.1 glycosyltransferase family 1 protein [Bacteroidota bacterium]